MAVVRKIGFAGYGIGKTPAPPFSVGFAGYGVGQVPAPASAAPPPPAPEAPPPPAALPIDPSYDQKIGALAQARDVTIGGLTGDRTRGLLNYGYTEDATGALQFDAANPFSQAAMMKRNYDQQRTGNTNGLAARGQLYSGALQNAQNNTNFLEAQGSNSLTNSLIDFLARNTQAKAQAGVTYSTGAAGAASDRFQNVGY